jgi:hypothetical protein
MVNMCQKTDKLPSTIQANEERLKQRNADGESLREIS